MVVIRIHPKRRRLYLGAVAILGTVGAFISRGCAELTFAEGTSSRGCCGAIAKFTFRSAPSKVEIGAGQTAERGAAKRLAYEVQHGVKAVPKVDVGPFIVVHSGKQTAEEATADALGAAGETAIKQSADLSRYKALELKHPELKGHLGDPKDVRIYARKNPEFSKDVGLEMYLNDKAGWARYSPANLARQPDIEARIHDRAVDAARDHFQRTADLMLGMSEDDVLRKAPELGAQYGVKITARDGLLTMSVGQSLDTSITMSAALLASLGGGALSADTFAKDSAEVRRKGVEMLSTITEEDLAGLDEQGLQNCVRRFQEQKGLKITLHFDSETLAVLDELMRRRSQSN